MLITVGDVVVSEESPIAIVGDVVVVEESPIVIVVEESPIVIVVEESPIVVVVEESPIVVVVEESPIVIVGDVVVSEESPIVIVAEASGDVTKNSRGVLDGFEALSTFRSSFFCRSCCRRRSVFAIFLLCFFAALSRDCVLLESNYTYFTFSVLHFTCLEL
jgi:hypothetical protein